MRTRPTMQLIHLIRSARIMRLLVLGAALSAATPAVSHAAPCSRPLAPPSPIAAPRDEDFRAMRQLELEISLNEVADYLECLRRESDEAAREARDVAQDWYAADPMTWR